VLGAASACVLLAAGQAARATGADPVLAGAIAAGAASSAQSAPAHPLQGRPLEGWVDARTGSSGRLNIACGVVSELTLTASGTKTFVNLTLANESLSTVVLLPTESTARFSSGLSRRLRSADGSDVALGSGWTTHLVFMFPDKADFKGQDWVEIGLRFATGTGGATCASTTRLDRDTTVAAAPGSYVAHSLLEIQFSGGARFATTGGLRAVAAPVGSAVDFGFAWYPWLRHGFLADIVLDGYGARGATLIAPALLLGQPRLSGAGLFVGYSVRAYPAAWLSLAYQPSVGPYGLELIDGPNGPSKATSGVLALRERLRVSARLGAIADGTEFSFTLSLVHLFLPYGSMGAVHDVAGHTLSGLISFVVGG
jgi:hypothetical protein